MRDVYHNKLVRDKIPEIIEKGGNTPVTHVLEGDAFLKALDDKLLEEVQEYRENPSIEELADIVEVLEAIVAMRGIPQAELRRAKNAKALKRGSFRERIYLEKVVQPDPVGDEDAPQP